MKKVLSCLMALVLTVGCAFSLASCSKSENAKYDIVFITDGASVDDGGYNKNAWEGVKNYAEQSNTTCRYYQPSLNADGVIDNEIIDRYINLSIKDGAKYIVCQGDAFNKALSENAANYKDVNFLLVGSSLENAQPNVMTITFDALEAGFLAGYTSVSKGMTKLGYLGAVNESSAQYGAGYVQGAAYAADEAGVPVVMEYANHDAKDLAYDYSFSIRPVYQKIEDCKEQTFKVNVVDGLGSGVYTDGENVTITANPAPEGKKFDHWEVKSDTEGVKDSKVNISSNKKSQMNLLVEKCDCTIRAVWADADTTEVIIETPSDAADFQARQGLSRMFVDSTLYYEKNSTNWVEAPAAPEGMVFDHWESNVESVLEDVNSKGTNISVGENEQVLLSPIYKISEEPTFYVSVENGTGTGAYKAGDWVNLVADAPQDGYMFYKWENIDNQGLSTGISMKNEYCYTTSFEMVDRFSSIPEAMYDEGTQVIFGGGNDQSISIFTATWKISHQVYGFGWGIDENGMGNCLSSVVNDYNVAIQNALKDYKGGSNYVGNCSNNCLYVTNVTTDAIHTDKDGNEVANDDYNEGFVNAYKALSDGSVKLTASTDPRTVNTSNCLTLNYWVK